MPLQAPLTQPAYTDLHAILTHYEAKEAGLGHRIASRLRDKLQRGVLQGDAYEPEHGAEGCLFCTVAEECGIPVGFDASREAESWARQSPLGPVMPRPFFPIGHAESWTIRNIDPGMTPATSPVADSLDACIEDWQHIQEATLPAHSVKVVAQGWTPRDFAALKEQVIP